MSAPRSGADPPMFPPPPPPPPVGVAAGQRAPLRRPPVVIVAILLMVPAAVTWLIAGIGFTVAIARLEGDYLFLFWIIALGILGICLLLVLLTVTGMRHAWRGRSTLLTVPAGGTTALFVLALVNLLIRGRLEYQPTMLTPLVVGGLAAVAFALLKTPPARAWFRQGRR